MKCSDLPILHFFSKKSSTTSNINAHDIVEDIDDEDENEEFLLDENQHNEDYHSKVIHNDDEDSNTSTTTCPVCHKMLLGDNDKINKHIDLCLNGEMIRTTIKEEDQRTSPQANHNKRYVDLYFRSLWFACFVFSIHSTQSKSTPPGKRQRRQLNITSQSTHGIDNYFFRTDSK
jgi:hypothetical protein